MKGKLTRLPRAEQWADRICTQVGKSVEAIIEVGRLLVKAKADLAHGEWGRLFEDKLVPFGQETARQLMAVSQHPVLSNSKHAWNLPPAWTSLYELTKVEPKRLTAAFKDGLITPDMQRRDVQALLSASKRAASHRPTMKGRSADTAYRTAGSRLYFRIARLLADDFDALAVDEQDEVLSLLDQTLSELRHARLTKVAG
jgi:hypothetical protein